MPASLRFVLALFAVGVVAAAVSIFFVYRNDDRDALIAAQTMTAGDAGFGKQAIARFGCGACHEIEGISGATGKVGPSLTGFAGHATIAGKLPNQPDQLMLWLRQPHAVVPGNAMPNQPIGDRDLRNIAAHLYTLR
jgi:cytochrome c2